MTAKPNTESDKSIDTILTSLKKYNLGQDPITEEPFTVEETMSFYPELKSAKSQLLAEILKAIGEDEEVPNDTWFREYGRLLGTDHREYIEMDNKRKANAIKAFYRTKFKELFNVKEK